MEIIMKSIFPLIMILLTLGCSHQTTIQLPRPDRPQLQPLHKNESFCSDKNAKILLNNTNELLIFAEQLEILLNTYEQMIPNFQNEKISE